MKIPVELKYTATHEWIRFTEAGTALIGITDHAQDELGDIVYINLPSAGDKLTAGKIICDIESVKAVSDIYSPFSGTLVKVNEALNDSPELINKAPYEAWIAEIADIGGSVELMDAGGYEKLISGVK